MLCDDLYKTIFEYCDLGSMIKLNSCCKQTHNILKDYIKAVNEIAGRKIVHILLTNPELDIVNVNLSDFEYINRIQELIYGKKIKRIRNYNVPRGFVYGYGYLLGNVYDATICSRHLIKKKSTELIINKTNNFFDTYEIHVNNLPIMERRIPKYQNLFKQIFCQ